MLGVVPRVSGVSSRGHELGEADEIYDARRASHTKEFIMHNNNSSAARVEIYRLTRWNVKVLQECILL